MMPRQQIAVEDGCFIGACQFNTTAVCMKDKGLAVRRAGQGAAVAAGYITGTDILIDGGWCAR
jgi:hypothetical protein